VQSFGMIIGETNLAYSL